MIILSVILIGFDFWWGVRELNLKQLIVAIIKKKNEDIAEILDEGIEEIEDNRRGHLYGRHPQQMDDYGMSKEHYKINDNTEEDEGTTESDEGV